VVRRQVLLVNSEGLELTQRVTRCAIKTRSGTGPGAGFASDAARSLDGLNLDDLFRRADRRRCANEREEAPLSLDEAPSLVLSPEATAELVEMLNHRAFSATAYCQGTSFLREHLGVQVFDQRLHLLQRELLHPDRVTL